MNNNETTNIQLAVWKRFFGLLELTRAATFLALVIVVTPKGLDARAFGDVAITILTTFQISSLMF